MSLRTLSKVLQQMDNAFSRAAAGRSMMVREPTWGRRLPLAPTAAANLPALAAGPLADPLTWGELDRELATWAPSAAMPMDVYERDDQYEIDIDVPSGVKKDDVEVTKSPDDKTVTISAERKRADDVASDQFFLKERSIGRVERVITVPDSIDMGQISCRFEDGVLRLTMPKATPAVMSTEKVQIE